MRIRSVVFLLLLALTAFSQSTKWENDLVLNYKMTDKNGKLKNYIEIKKDTLHYQWIDKEKISSKMIVSDTALENKLIAIMDKHKFLKFKSAKMAKPGPNIVFVQTKAGKQKTIVMPQNIKAGSKEEAFIKEFLETALVKVFAHELKNLPK